MHYKLFLKNLSKTLLVNVGYLPMSGEADELMGYMTVCFQNKEGFLLIMEGASG